MPSETIRTSYLVTTLQQQSINSVFVRKVLFFQHARTHTETQCCLLYYNEALIPQPVFPQNKGQQTNNQPIISVSVLMMLLYVCVCVFFFSSPWLFHRFVQQFLLVQDKSDHYFFFFSHLLFLSACKPHQRKTLICTSSSTGVCFKQPAWSRRRLGSLPKYRCEVWQEQVH